MKRNANKNKEKRFVRNIISIVLAFILSVCATLLSAVFIVRVGIINKNTYYKTLNSSGYYSCAYNELMANIRSTTIPTGFPERIYENLITESDVCNDIIGSFEAQSKKIQYTTMASDIMQQLRKNIDEYFAETGYEAGSDEENKLINIYIETVASAYRECVNVPINSYILRADKIADKIFWWAFAGLIAMASIIIFIIFRLYKHIYYLLRYVSYAFTGSAFMLLACPSYIYLSKVHYRLNLTPESFYKLFITYIDSSLKMFINFGVFLFIVGVLFAIPGIFVKNT